MSDDQFWQQVQNDEQHEWETTNNKGKGMNEIAAYSPVLAVIGDLEQRYKDVVFDVTTTDGLQDAKKSYKEINAHSIILEEARKKEKAESLAYGKWVDSEAKRISEKLDALRLPIKAQIEVETKRAEREKEEADRLAAEKFNREQAELKAAEEAKLAAQRAEIARQQAELEAAQRASRLKIEEEERAARMAREEADRAARLLREAEEAKLKAERDRLEAEARAIAEAKRKEQEAEEAKQREIQRQKDELLDGKAMLRTFVDRYGKRAEFVEIAKAIVIHLEGF